MASFSAPTKACKISLIFCLLFFCLATVNVSCFQYEVGGDKGWIKPDGSEYETYNEWAEQKRFHIGDTIYFKYSNDSVLQVEREDYEGCSVNNPISKFEDGKTVFEFDHSGFFYFISGKPGHCQAGQKMIIRVMVQSGAHHPTTSAPALSPKVQSQGPGGDSGGWNHDSRGPPLTNSTDMLSVTSCFLTLFMGMVIVLYLFMD